MKLFWQHKKPHKKLQWLLPDVSSTLAALIGWLDNPCNHLLSRMGTHQKHMKKGEFLQPQFHHKTSHLNQESMDSQSQQEIKLQPKTSCHTSQWLYLWCHYWMKSQVHTKFGCKYQILWIHLEKLIHFHGPKWILDVDSIIPKFFHIPFTADT